MATTINGRRLTVCLALACLPALMGTDAGPLHTGDSEPSLLEPYDEHLFWLTSTEAPIIPNEFDDYLETVQNSNLSDEEFDYLMGVLEEREGQEKAAQKVLAFTRRGPRQLDLAVESFDPSGSSLDQSQTSPADCAVCLSELDESAIKLTNCGHVFHKECISRWSLQQDFDEQPVSTAVHESWPLLV